VNANHSFNNHFNQNDNHDFNRKANPGAKRRSDRPAGVKADPSATYADATPLFAPTLAGRIAAIQLQLSSWNDGTAFALDLSPTLLESVCDLWPQFSADSSSRTLIIDPDAAGRDRYDEARWTFDALDWSASPVAVLDDAAFHRAVRSIDAGGDVSKTVIMVRLAGPIEAGDVCEICSAYENGLPILDAELRAEQVLIVRSGRVVRAESRGQSSVLALAGRLFQLHIGNVRLQPWSDFSMPAPWQLERLLSVTGTLSVRPLETEVYSSIVDVGISTADLERTGPSSHGLIYDIVSDTWHDEP
jgi:hypothetical protein